MLDFCTVFVQLFGEGFQASDPSVRIVILFKSMA
jgi:hypothetical protein